MDDICIEELSYVVTGTVGVCESGSNYCVQSDHQRRLLQQHERSSLPSYLFHRLSFAQCRLHSYPWQGEFT